jgi:hypothetical protein
MYQSDASDADPGSMSHYLTQALAVSLVGAALVLGACSGVGDFTFTEKSEPQTIQSSIAGELANLAGFDFNINLERQLEKRNASGAKAVHLQDVELRVTDDSQGRNLDFLESITFRANSENNDKVRVAWRDPIPDGNSSVMLTTDDNVNLKPYIEEGLTMETSATGNPPEEDTTIQAVLTLEVEVL